MTASECLTNNDSIMTELVKHYNHREEKRNSPISPKKMFSCKRCYYKTDRKNNLKRHMTAMHEVTTQKLECCGVRFLNKADLKLHNTRSHFNGYTCPICSQHFVRKALLERHFSVHTGEKKFACECGYKTSHKSNLERHYKTHLKGISSEPMQTLWNPVSPLKPHYRIPSLTPQFNISTSSFLHPSTSLPRNPETSRITNGSLNKPKRGFTVDEILGNDNKHATSSNKNMDLAKRPSISHRKHVTKSSSVLWKRCQETNSNFVTSNQFIENFPKLIRPVPSYVFRKTSSRSYSLTPNLPFSDKLETRSHGIPNEPTPPNFYSAQFDFNITKNLDSNKSLKNEDKSTDSTQYVPKKWRAVKKCKEVFSQDT